MDGIGNDSFNDSLTIVAQSFRVTDRQARREQGAETAILPDDRETGIFSVRSGKVKEISTTPEKNPHGE